MPWLSTFPKLIQKKVYHLRMAYLGLLYHRVKAAAMSEPFPKSRWLIQSNFIRRLDENLAASGCQEKEGDKIALFWPCLEKIPILSVQEYDESVANIRGWNLLSNAPNISQVFIQICSSFTLLVLFHSLNNFLLPSLCKRSMFIYRIIQ